MAIWIIGSNSFLGAHLSIKLKIEELDFHTASRDGFGADVQLDLLDDSTFQNVKCSESDFVILLAGISSPEECHRNYASAHKVNVVGTSKFIDYVLSRGARVLFASSDTVYGNQEDSVDERTICIPNGEYGVMKHIIETNFTDNQNFMSFRLSYICADNDKFTKFLKHQSLTGTTTDAFVDFFRNTVDLEDVLEGLVKACQNWDQIQAPRIINFSGSDCLSRFELAKRINQRHALNLSIRGVPAPEGFFDSRPRIINLRNQKFRRLLELESQKQE
jgi:dTDP-4-dehydrorhamnose reductase